MTNTLSYLAQQLVKKKKRFITLAPGVDGINFFICSTFTLLTNKLVYFALARLSSQLSYWRATSQLTLVTFLAHTRNIGLGRAKQSSLTVWVVSDDEEEEKKFLDQHSNIFCDQFSSKTESSVGESRRRRRRPTADGRRISLLCKEGWLLVWSLSCPTNNGETEDQCSKLFTVVLGLVSCCVCHSWTLSALSNISGAYLHRVQLEAPLG